MTATNALIIDDNPYNVDVLSAMLEMEGIQTTHVLEPLNLDAMLADLECPDIVFLDLEMPGMDGYAVLEVLKSDPRFQETPIVAYTVHHAEIMNARKHGFHSFLPKPLDSDRFPAQLARILRGEPVWTT